MDEAGADRGRQRDAELRRRHGAGDGPEHLAAALDVPPVGEERVARRARVEVLVVAEDELEDGELGGRHGSGCR